MSSLICPKCHASKMLWIDSIDRDDWGEKSRMQCQNPKCRKIWTMKSFSKACQTPWWKKVRDNVPPFKQIHQALFILHVMRTLNKKKTGS